jgi:peptide/nickel transport system substrate-binding protein
MDWFDGALRSVSAPDSRTVVFKLSRPVPNFDYFAQLPVMAPVPRSRDDGAGYGAHVAATGPYKIASAVGQAFTFVRNPAYDAASDPLSKRAALPAEFDVRASVPPADLARGLHDKTIDMQIGAARDGTSGQVLGDSSGQAPVDTAVLPSIAYTLINSGVEPFANEDCRRAVILAADRSAYQRAYGGPAVALAATGLLPPADPGAEPKDAIKLEPSPQGDVAAAQQALVTCKRPGGFSTTLGYRQGNQRDAAAAAGLKTSLARVHIDVHITEFPAADLYTVLANNQPYSVQHRIGLVMAERSAAWPDAEPLLRTIVDGSASGVVANVDMRYLAEGAQLLRQDTLSPNEVARRGAWLQIDELAMLAAYVVPGAWGQNSLYRPKGVTNLIVNQAFGLYDYARLGKSGGK